MKQLTNKPYKMKTPMQEHLEWLKPRMVVTEQMEKELLEKERQMVIEAFHQGLVQPEDSQISANDYFELTYNNK